MEDRKLLGALGENLAEAMLYAEGYEILERNFRSRFGEIDIIGMQGDTVLFVEVKTRTGDLFGLPREAVSEQKMRRMRKTAEYYLMRAGLTDAAVAFDVIEILVDRIRDAF